MTDEAAIYLKKVFEEYTDCLYSYSAKINRCIRETEQNLDLINSELEAKTIDEFDIQACSFKFNSVINQLIFLRQSLGKDIDWFLTVNEFIPQKIIQEIGCVPVNFGVECAYENGAIYIRMPMLPRLYYRKTSTHIKADPDTSLGYGLRKELQKMLMKNEFDIKVFTEKTLSFLFVYNTQDQHIQDTDEHDTKNVIDELCHFFPGGDNGTQTSIILKTIVSDEVENGTYISVTSGKNSRPASPEETICRWKNIS